MDRKVRGIRLVGFAAFTGMLLMPAALSQTPAAAAPQTAPAMPAARVPPSLLDQSPAPPVIDLAAGQLTIHAANSSLRAILDDLETRTGTKVEGLSRDERIFGVYGPGNPQEVLSSLLDDSGYNVLIAGRKADGSPREVVLSARTGSGSTAPQSQTRTQAGDEDADTDSADSAPVPGPALFNPQAQRSFPQSPPAAAPNQAGSSPQPVKTPQQMLQELERLHQAAVPPQGAPQP